MFYVPQNFVMNDLPKKTCNFVKLYQRIKSIILNFIGIN